MRNMFIKSRLVLILGLVTASIILAPDRSTSLAGETSGPKIMEKEVIGKYLADDNGMSLYSFAKDEKNSSNCIEGCALNWPPFNVEISAIGEGLEADDFGVITRADGLPQTTYKGMPLYYFKNDKYPGDTFGEGLGDAWFLIKP
jgi:predicted lipoprotein with Yx(FWY)xxD motif